MGIQRMVLDFKSHIGEMTDREFPDGEVDDELLEIGQDLISLSRKMQTRRTVESVHSGRVVEEVGEMLVALGGGDRVGTYDGVLDSIYTLLGMCTTYGFPFFQGFEEIHKSNMTKDPDAMKGRHYVAPSLERLLPND